MVDERIAERRAEIRAQRRRVRLRRTVSVVVGLGLLVGVLAVERSALVALEEVTVSGTERLDAEAVRDAADLPLGTSILRLRLDAAAARVEQLALVRDADARRVDPLTVAISVEERRPALAVRGGGERRMIDRDGVLLPDEERGQLPLVVLDDPPPAVGGEVADDPALDNAFRAWRGLSGPIRSEVVRYAAAGEDELELVLDTGVTVRFGRASRVDEKVRALGAVLADVGDTPIEAVDVRAPDAPVVVGP